MHLIIKNHAFDHQASSMESTHIIHGINKHHVINKRKECYSIIDNIASLIATFKRYALVLRFFPPAHFNHWKLRYAASVPGDHGTSVPENIKWGVDPTILIIQTCSIAKIEDFFIVLYNFQYF